MIQSPKDILLMEKPLKTNKAPKETKMPLNYLQLHLLQNL